MAHINGIKDEDLDKALSQINVLPTNEQKELLAMIEQLEGMQNVTLRQNTFLKFIDHVYPGYKVGEHHRRLAHIFEDIANGKKKRVIVNIAPRHGKSELISYLAPAWFLGKYPHKKIIMASHTADLAVNFGRRVRNLVGSEAYRDIFPAVELQADSKSASRWGTNYNGEYFAIGVGGALAGRGADLFIIDDPHALEISTPIATPNGFVKIQNLKVGDYVFGPDGEPTKVVAKSPMYVDRPLYAVTTYDGETIYADAGHLWNVRTSTRIADPYKNLTTRKMLNSRSSAFMLPRHAAVQYPWRELTVDPWVLGAWLGDGTSSLGRMTAHPDDAVFMRREFMRRGYTTTDLADKFSFGVPRLREQLRDLGVLNAKRIPQEYMTAAFLQRMDLLCGLMDTDGNVTAQGQCAFHNKDQALVDQVVELLHSLGRKCQRRSYISKGKFGTCTMHRVTFKLKDSALMPRKRLRTRTTHDKQHRSITVAPTERTGAVQCITVERDDGLFLAGRGYVVTHNSEQDAKLGRSDVFLPAWEWFQSGPIQRLMPGGSIIVVMCMTGDTWVLRANGTETRLDALKVGDEVATYENNKITTAKVMNFKSNGIDDVYTVQTQSGIILQANERHPFLVEYEGKRQWIKLKDLRVGMLLVATKDAVDKQGHRQNRDSVPHVRLKHRTIRKTLTHLTTLLGIMANTKIKHVHTMDVMRQSKAKGIALTTITKFDGLMDTVVFHTQQKNDGMHDLKVAMGLRNQVLTRCLKLKAAFARFVNNRHLSTIQGHTGTISYALTIAMNQIKSAHYSVTTAIWPWGTQKQQKQHMPLQVTSDFTMDMIVEITPSGRKEVFDVQIERTENFIANGVVSHNTRWSKLDLTGQITNQMMKQEDVDDWEVVEFPAIIEDKDGNEKSLWPEFWPLEELRAKKAALDVRYWNAQYMQNPTSEEGALIKREWWKIWEKERPPECEFTIMSLDAAQEKNTRADYNALTMWGVFFNEETDNYNIILLNSIKERLEFPELKERVLREYKDWEPDAFIVEKKSNGAALYQEMRRMGIPVGEFTPGKGQDKIARVNAVSDLFRSGIVWAPDKRWAREVMEECNDFPSGANDDLVDSTTMALMRFRQGGFIRLPNDEVDEVREFRSFSQKRLYAI